MVYSKTGPPTHGNLYLLHKLIITVTVIPKVEKILPLSHTYHHETRIIHKAKAISTFTD